MFCKTFAMGLITVIRRFAGPRLFCCFLLPLILFSCATVTPRPAGEEPEPPEAPFPPGTIIDTTRNKAVSFEDMVKDLESVRIVYVGESHTNMKHHEIQLKILRALHDRLADLCVGMEMFARPYQDILDRWSAGEMDEDVFLRQTHWYANWRYDFSYYRDLLHYIRENRIPLYGLNIEFHIPSRISSGGLDNLLPYQKKRLPGRMDLFDGDHRDYVRGVYEKHGDHVTERYRFEDFYAAQVVWDEVMADSITRFIGDRVMLVFTGKGHITDHFGIPRRAWNRGGLSYRTVLPQGESETIRFSAADYIWITP